MTKKKRRAKGEGRTQLRTLALYQDGGTIRTRETDEGVHVIEGVSLIQAVEALGHGMMIDGVTLDQIVALASPSTGSGQAQVTP